MRNQRKLIGNIDLLKKHVCNTRDFLADQGTLPFHVGGVGLIPGQALKVPHASWPKNQNMKSRSNIVTNSIKTLEMVHVKKKKKKSTKAQRGVVARRAGWWVCGLGMPRMGRPLKSLDVKLGCLDWVVSSQAQGHSFSLNERCRLQAASETYLEP